MLHLIRLGLMRATSFFILLCGRLLCHAVNVEYMTGNDKPIEYQDFEGAQVCIVQLHAAQSILLL